MEIVCLDGERQGSKIIHRNDGFYYHYNNGQSCGEDAFLVYLRCKNWHISQCQGTAKMIIVGHECQWTDLQNHSCAPDASYSQVHRARQQILRESANLQGPYETPSEVVSRIRTRFPDHVAAQVTAVGMRSAISRVRAGFYPPVPATLDALGACLAQLPHLAATLDGRDSVFCGVARGPGTTSIVFMSRRMRRHLSRARIVFCDGTFGSRPNTPHSSQVLQIVTEIDYHVMPLAQVLMTGKTLEEYRTVLRFIKQQVPDFHPAIVVTDFEAGLQGAWREEYRCQVTGCYWHFCRAASRMVRQLGLTAYLQENEAAKSLIRSFLAIPLLPQHLMARGLQSLMAEAHRRDILGHVEPYINYFINTWFSASHFESLSVFRMQHRTNNCAESANKMLRAKTGVHKPGVWHFIHALRKYENEAHLTQLTLDAGLPVNRPRRVTAIANDRRCQSYSRQLLRGRLVINRFLHVASRRVMHVHNHFLAH